MLNSIYSFSGSGQIATEAIGILFIGIHYRAQLKGAEVIIFKDNSGKNYAFYFDSSKIVRI